MNRILMTLVLAALVTASVEAQNRKGPSSTTRKEQKAIDKMLEAALEANPDLLLAEAKVREAEAELQRARLEVTRQVVALFHKKASIDERLAESKRIYEEAKMRHAAGVSTSQDVSQAMLSYMKTKEEHARIDAEANYLLGAAQVKVARRKVPVGVGTAVKTAPRIPGVMAAILQKQVDVNLGTSLKQAMDGFATEAGCTFVIHPDVGDHLEERPAAASLRVSGPLSLKAALTLYADMLDLVFVVRDYGIHVVTPLTASARHVGEYRIE